MNLNQDIINGKKERLASLLTVIEDIKSEVGELDAEYNSMVIERELKFNEQEAYSLRKAEAYIPEEVVSQGSESYRCGLFGSRICTRATTVYSTEYNLVTRFLPTAINIQEVYIDYEVEIASARILKGTYEEQLAGYSSVLRSINLEVIQIVEELVTLDAQDAEQIQAAAIAQIYETKAVLDSAVDVARLAVQNFEAASDVALDALGSTNSALSFETHDLFQKVNDNRDAWSSHTIDLLHSLEEANNKYYQELLLSRQKDKSILWSLESVVRDRVNLIRDIYHETIDLYEEREYLLSETDGLKLFKNVTTIVGVGLITAFMSNRAIKLGKKLL